MPETRQASHILIAADKSAGADAKQKARAQAEQIAAELKQNPNNFAELAKKHSQDPGSAAKGGDLGTFSRGAMVKAFDDAVFNMKPGEISAPVETEYGYHIIRVTGVTPGQMKSFEQVRPEIENELKKQRAGRRFAELAEQFNNTVFEQSDSLKPAAELIKQTPQKSGWITRTGTQEARLEQSEALAGDLLGGRARQQAQHRSDRDRARDDRRRACDRAQAGRRAAFRGRERRRSRRSSSRAARVSSRRRTDASCSSSCGREKGVQPGWSAPQLVSRARPEGLAGTCRAPGLQGGRSEAAGLRRRRSPGTATCC